MSHVYICTCPDQSVEHFFHFNEFTREKLYFSFYLGFLGNIVYYLDSDWKFHFSFNVHSKLTNRSGISVLFTLNLFTFLKLPIAGFVNIAGKLLILNRKLTAVWLLPLFVIRFPYSIDLEKFLKFNTSFVGIVVIVAVIVIMEVIKIGHHCSYLPLKIISQSPRYLAERNVTLDYHKTIESVAK